MFGRQERLEFAGEETTRKSRRWLWISAVAIVVVGAIAFFMMSSSKPADTKGAAAGKGAAGAGQSQMPTVTVATPGRQTVQTIVSRTISDGLLTTADYGNIDVLLIVPFSPDAPGAGSKRFVWPHANQAQSFLAGTNVSTDQRMFGFIFAPPDFAAQDGR